MIAFGKMVDFIKYANVTREDFPELAKELDKCLFDVLNNHTPKCGHGTCSCQTRTFEQFHAERNTKFSTASEAQSNEFIKS